MGKIDSDPGYGPQEVAMAPFRGGVLLMVPPYAASQAVAPLANVAPQVVGAAFHELMSWLKAAAPYSIARSIWARGVSVDTKSRRQATTKQ